MRGALKKGILRRPAASISRLSWEAPSYLASLAAVRFLLLHDAFKQMQHFDLPEKHLDLIGCVAEHSKNVPKVS